MSTHTTALVPIETWAYQSPLLKDAGQSLDMGLLAEALLYYDRVLVVVMNEPEFVAFVEWFVDRNLFADLLALLRDGTLNIYYYAFFTGPALKDGSYSLANFSDERASREPIFFERVIGHRSLDAVLKKGRHRDKLIRALEGRVTEVKSAPFSEAILEARADFVNEGRSALAVQALLDEVRPLLRTEAPETVTAAATRTADGTNIKTNVNFDALRDELGPTLGFHRGTPISGLAVANRLLRSAALEECDLYLPAPVSSLVGDKLSETESRLTKTQAVVEELVHEVEFPDIRMLVNESQIDLAQVLGFRRRSGRFRAWLQDERDRDRNALLAYHHEVGRDSGLITTGRKTLRLFGHLTSLGAPFVLPGNASASEKLAVAASVQATRFLLELAASRHEGWRPVVFGNWLRARVAISGRQAQRHDGLRLR